MELFTTLTFNVTNITTTNHTLNSTAMPQAAKYYWRLRSYDGYNYSNYSANNSIDITYAKITITSPAGNAIVNAGQSVSLSVIEEDNGIWITTANFIIIGDGSNTAANLSNTTATQVTNWTGTYVVPDVSSRIITLFAHGVNSSLGISVNHSINLRITRSIGSAVGNPNISTFFTDPTYVQVNRSANITLIIDADVLLDDVVAQVTWPNNTIQILTRNIGSDGNSTNSFVYYYNYTFDANLTGNYTIKINATDINYPTSGLILANTTVYSNNTQTINITGISIENYTLKDISSKRVFFKGANITQVIVPGRYDLDVETGSTKLLYALSNLSLISGNIAACNFTEIDETITSPANSRAVDQWITSCDGVSAQSIGITYDYTTKTASITNEENIELYKCNDITNCGWSKITDGIFTNLNHITANMTNFSVFMLSEDTAPTPVSTPAGGGASGGGGGGATADRLISIDIISPAPLSIYKNDTIIAPLFIKNNGEIVLRGIKLTAESPSDGLELELTDDTIDTLFVGQEVSADLIIRSSKELTSESHEIIITASVTDPQFKDSVKFFVNLLEFGITEKKLVIEKIEFLRKLLEGNPECLELQELIDNAQESLEKEEIDKALKTVEAAIQACKELVSLQGKELQVPKKISFETYIALAEILALVLVIYMIYRYYKKRHKK